MRRPFVIWVVCLAGLLAFLGATGFLTHIALEANASQERAQHERDREEATRLALWRMETALLPVIATEASRPYYVYQPFYPTERAYTVLFEEIPKNLVQVASPLLLERPRFVQIHFQIDEEGDCSSPQVPLGNSRDVAESRFLATQLIQCAGDQLDVVRKLAKEDERLVAMRDRPITPPLIAMNYAAAAQQREDNDRPQELRNRSEWVARNNMVQNAYQTVGNPTSNEAFDDNVPPQLVQGDLECFWSDGQLVLARQVVVHGKHLVQGAILNWAQIQDDLLASVKDLLPEAQLVPHAGSRQGREDRLLAAIPARLVPGRAATPPQEFLSTIPLSLGIAWTCALVGGLGLVFLLRSAVQLSERRAAFVSAVTHELRTPLTTFRMYTEMLTSGMVRDEAKRQQYLTTLQDESDRLTHLVENVLAYARLERGKATGRVAWTTLDGLFEGARKPMEDRARETEAALHIVLPDVPLRDVEVFADARGVERVLMNLVDNACKYACPTPRSPITVQVQFEQERVQVHVIDQGPGIPVREERRIFKPFRKSAGEAALSAPGVGLGLALGQRLARSMGGDLTLRRAEGGGAQFTLTLRARMRSSR